MWKQLLYKWFGLIPGPACETCEVLREQLVASERERRELLHRLLERDKSEPAPPPVVDEEMRPVGPTFTPFRVKQAMLEAEDRKTAQLMRARKAEISQLEKELDIPEGA